MRSTSGTDRTRRRGSGGAVAHAKDRCAWTVAAGIAGATALVLAYIVVLYRAGGSTAIDSVRAMVFRTVVWVLLLLFIGWTGRATRRAD